MTKSEKFKLIEGKFLHEDAKEILTNIFVAKINFHHLKNFSSQERFGKDDEIAIKRIPELRSEIAKLEQVIAEAEAQNKKLVIDSEIVISFSND